MNGSIEVNANSPGKSSAPRMANCQFSPDESSARLQYGEGSNKRLPGPPGNLDATIQRVSFKIRKTQHQDQQTAAGGRSGRFSFAAVEEHRKQQQRPEQMDPLNRNFDRQTAMMAGKRSSIHEGIHSSMRALVHASEELETAIGVKSDGLTGPLATALLINLISIGYLSLPYVFAQAGTILSSIGFAIIILQAFITSQYVLEACARAHFLADAAEKIGTTRRHAHKVLSRSFKEDQSNQPRDFENTEHITEHTTEEALHASNEFFENYTAAPHTIDGRFKAEMPELCQMFLSRGFSLFFLATISLDLYGLTWSYASIFANGLAKELPIQTSMVSGYVIYILIFAAIVVPLSCMQLGDSILLQLVFLFGRMVMFLLMISTVAASWVSGTSHFDEYIGPSEPPIPMFGFASLYMLLQVSIFSTAFQFAVPGIADASRHKSSILKICATTCTFIFVTVCVCSLVLSTYFGSEWIQSSSNLNWETYHGGTGTLVEEDGMMKRTGVSTWAKAISGFVVVFPAIDSLAVFPLCAISLGEIVMDAWYGGDTALVGRKKRTAFRLLGCCPQIVGAVFVSDLSVIANYAGLFTTLSYSVCPALLSIYSRKALTNAGFSPHTAYKTPFSNDCVAWTICWSALGMMLYVVVSSVMVESREE